MLSFNLPLMLLLFVLLLFLFLLLLSFSLFSASSFTVFFFYFAASYFTVSFSSFLYLIRFHFFFFLHLLLFLLLFLSILSPLIIRFLWSSFGLLLFYCLLFSSNYYCFFLFRNKQHKYHQQMKQWNKRIKLIRKRTSRKNKIKEW